MILCKFFQQMFKPSADYANMVRKALIHPSCKIINQVGWWFYFHQPIITKNMSLWSYCCSLEDNKMVFVVNHPKPENGDFNPNFDGGIQTSRDLVIKVSGNARTKGGSHIFTELSGSHTSMPQCQCRL